MLARRFSASLFVTLWLGCLLPFAAWAVEKTYDCPRLYAAQNKLSIPVSIGKEGWFFRANELKEQFEILPQTADYLKRLSDAFASQGSKLILMPIPLRSAAAGKYIRKDQPYQHSFNLARSRQSFQEYLRQISAIGIPVVDMFRRVDNVDEKTQQGFFLRRDVHWSPYGSMLAAESAAAALSALPDYKTIKPIAFETKFIGMLDKKELFASELQEYCDDILPPEKIPAYATTQKLVAEEASADEGESALFGDEDVESTQDLVVLLGSSFSAEQDFNFAGFLAEKTKMEVANFAISAGQLFNAIVSYASLPKKDRLSPRFVIWENLAHYDLNEGERMFRQIIPAIHGECSAEEAIAHTTLKIESGKGQKIFSLPKSENIHGQNYFIYLQSNNLGLARFTLNLDYADGDGEWFTVDRTEHFNNTGRFFMELSEELDAPLTRVTLDGMDDLNAEMKIRLCRSDNNTTKSTGKDL